MTHLPLTAYDAPAHTLAEVAALAADYGVPAEVAPIVLNATEVDLDGMPEGLTWAAVRRMGRWYALPLAEVGEHLAAGRLVVAA